MTQQPRALVVSCHPNPRSRTHAVLAAVQAGLGAACEVETVDLYACGFDPALVVDETRRRRDLDKVEATREHRELLARCDAVVFVCPVWWGGFPAMLKGWLDRTFVSGLTYSFADLPRTAVFPRGLMRGKEAHFFYTLDSPWIVAWLDPGWFSSLFTIFWYCGFSTVRRHDLARLELTTEDRPRSWPVIVRARGAPGDEARRQAPPRHSVALPRRRVVPPVRARARDARDERLPPVVHAPPEARRLQAEPQHDAEPEQRDDEPVAGAHAALQRG